MFHLQPPCWVAAAAHTCLQSELWRTLIYLQACVVSFGIIEELGQKEEMDNLKVIAEYMRANPSFRKVRKNSVAGKRCRSTLTLSRARRVTCLHRGTLCRAANKQSHSCLPICAHLLANLA